jgi:hypothetical protein
VGGDAGEEQEEDGESQTVKSMHGIPCCLSTRTFRPVTEVINVIFFLVITVVRRSGGAFSRRPSAAALLNLIFSASEEETASL